MLYETLPGSDLKVSRVCLGTWQFNGGAADLTWNPQDVKVSKDIVNKALSEGINFIDTAEAYNNSEKVLGDILDLQSRRGDIVIASKFGQKHPQGVVGYSAVDIERALTGSLQTLKTSYIDLYQIHWPICVADMSEAVQQLELEKARGRIRHYGICNFGAKNMEALRTAGGKPLTNQLPYNLLWRAIEHDVLPKAAEVGATVLAYSPLQQGLLTGRFWKVDEVPEGRRRTRLFSSTSTSLATHGGDGAETETFKAIEKIGKICADEGISMTTGALSWLLAQPNVASVIVGCSTVEQVVENTRIHQITPAVEQKLKAATEELKHLMGTNADLWAPESRMK
ncbi:putative General stress protein 69 [Hypsibius exemplaris]|uniref:General stress protein 69 n=1 Tax=Hypsibius exemplaris TaxID=2072580 RepID=A0A1W0X3S5_HYPEX|nr:putative General stress protein 69 [Hypsibius exemplaris]